MSLDQQIKHLCEKAGIPKPFEYSAWVFMRSAGVNKSEASTDIGVSRWTLTNYEDLVEDNLSIEEKFRLIRACVNREYAERIVEGDGDE